MLHFFQNNVLRHVLAWVGIFMFTALRFTLYNEPIYFGEALIFNGAYVIPQVILAYLLLYVLVPRLYVQKRYFTFVLVFFLLLYLLSFMARYLTVHAAEPLVRVPPFEQETPWEIATDLGTLFGRYAISILYVVGIFLAFVYFKAYHTEREKALILATQKSQAELKNLKAQLNPHFLFNTLNNIYSLSVLQSPQTSTAIAKLAELLDYTLYRCNADVVPLSAELRLVNTYLELEKLRYTDRLKITLTENITYDAMVPPLVFLSLVENAFKHGSGEDPLAPSINIDLHSDASELRLLVANTFQPGVVPRGEEAIGLNNIRQQLRVLFPDRHSLVVTDEGNWFKVFLSIKHSV